MDFSISILKVFQINFSDGGEFPNKHTPLNLEVQKYIWSGILNVGQSYL